MVQRCPKSGEAIANLVLALSGVGIILTASQSWQGFSSLVGIAGGAALVTTAYVRDEKYQLTDSDYSNGFRDLIESIESSFKMFWKESKPLVKQAIPVKFLPEKYQSFAAVQMDRMLSEDWVRSFVKRSKLVVGVTRSGKTTYLLHEIATFFQDHSNGYLTICDFNYGKPDENGFINTWYDLPRDRFIRTEYSEIVEALNTEWEELQDRRLICMPTPPTEPEAAQRWKELNSRRKECTTFDGRIRLQRRKFLIDETIAIIKAAENRDKLKQRGEPKDLPRIQMQIGDLLYQGLGYQMELTFGLQTLAVGENGLNLAMQEQLNVLLLGASAINTDNVSRLPGTRDSIALINELKQVRRMPGCQYAAIAKIGNDDPAIKVMPVIDVSQIELQLPEAPKTELEMWWEEVYSNEVQANIDRLAAEFAEGKIKSPLKEIAKSFKTETRNNDPRYRLVKETWETALKKAKEQIL